MDTVDSIRSYEQPRLEANSDATLAEHAHNQANAYRAMETLLAKMFANLAANGMTLGDLAG
jgi:hypothetical protein